MVRFAWIPLLLWGCDGNEVPTDSDTEGCPNLVQNEFPDDGSSGAYIRTAIDFLLLNVEQAATVTLADDAGASVSGSTSWVGRRIVFTPDAPLANSATYTATLDNWGCPDPVTTTFTTGTTGMDPVAGTALGGNTWGFAVAEGRVVDPPEIEAVVPMMLTFDFLLTALSASDTDVQFIGAVSDEMGDQSLCSPSIDFPQPADLTENPYFTVVADNMDFVLVGDPLAATNVRLTGTFSADGSTMEGVYLAALVDMGAELCDLMSSSGVDCLACTGGGNTCLDLIVDDMTATPRTTAVFEWAETDIVPEDCEVTTR